MTVSATNLPAGATVASIVSASAFDLSVATTGRSHDDVQRRSGQAQVVQASIDSNVEDDDVLGSVSPNDFLNKQFRSKGSSPRCGRTNRLQDGGPRDAERRAGAPRDIKNTDVSSASFPRGRK